MVFGDRTLCSSFLIGSNIAIQLRRRPLGLHLGRKCLGLGGWRRGRFHVVGEATSPKRRNMANV
jgi:hypothetical protein